MPRSSVPTRTLPLITSILIAVNLLAYAHELMLGGSNVCATYGLIPARFTVETLFTSLFLHDPSGLAHILGNMAFLAFFGTLVEQRFGHLRFLGLYLTAGAAGGLLHVLVDPSVTIPLVGASGAICGVLAVAGALRPRLLGFVAAFIGINVWNAFVGDSGNVSFGCHIGGFVVGVLVVATMRLSGSEIMETA